MKRSFELEPASGGANPPKPEEARSWWKRIIDLITRRPPEDKDADLEMSCY